MFSYLQNKHSSGAQSVKYRSKKYNENRTADDNSSSAGSKEIHIYVGKSTAEQVIRIPTAALKGCTFFRENLVNGCSIPYVDPRIFKAVVNYLDSQGILGMVKSTSAAFEPIVLGEDVMLKFAKTWQLAHELDLPELQNKLIDIFRVFYPQLRQDKIILAPSAAAFTWLRDTVGHHSRAEKFLVDFYAGLHVDDKRFTRLKVSHLPDDVAKFIFERREFLVWNKKDDRILNGSSEFKVHKNEPNVRLGIQVVAPSSPPATLTKSQHTLPTPTDKRRSVMKQGDAHGASGRFSNVGAYVSFRLPADEFPCSRVPLTPDAFELTSFPSLRLPTASPKYHQDESDDGIVDFFIITCLELFYIYHTACVIVVPALGRTGFCVVSTPISLEYLAIDLTSQTLAEKFLYICEEPLHYMFFSCSVIFIKPTATSFGSLAQFSVNYDPIADNSVNRRSNCVCIMKGSRSSNI